MISSPRSPSTMLSRVSATTIPSSPVLILSMTRNIGSVYDPVNVDWTINMKDATWLSAAEAAKRLGVNVTTLYAYVSRGFIRSEPSAGKSRARRYRREDVEHLRSRNEERRDPGKAGQRALHWGVPVLESSFALIADGRLYYRGHDVAELARPRTVEEGGSLLWTGA